jgi:hypothetical protein
MQPRTGQPTPVDQLLGNPKQDLAANVSRLASHASHVSMTDLPMTNDDPIANDPAIQDQEPATDCEPVPGASEEQNLHSFNSALNNVLEICGLAFIVFTMKALVGEAPVLFAGIQILAIISLLAIRKIRPIIYLAIAFPFSDLVYHLLIHDSLNIGFSNFK